MDIVPEPHNYYDKLAVRPGFDLYQAIVNAKSPLHINIPETLYYNYSTHFLYTEKVGGKIIVEKNPKKR